MNRKTKTIKGWAQELYIREFECCIFKKKGKLKQWNPKYGKPKKVEIKIIED